tara:strand:+ start:1015 stop:1149 length:135 start_codon:yes stop_codon:yes gene_type:complete
MRGEGADEGEAGKNPAAFKEKMYIPSRIFSSPPPPFIKKNPHLK